MLKRRPCRLQTADCADWVLFYLLLMNYLVLELHKLRTMILDQDCLFQTTTTYWCECMEKIQLSIPEWKPAQKDTLGNRKKEKKNIYESLTRIFRGTRDIGICKIWRNDSKSPVWITEWKQRRSSTMKEIEEMSLVAVVGGRKGFYFKPPNLKKLLLLKKTK